MDNINIQKILELLPHRYPFLLVDRVLELEEGKITTIKNVTFNEPQFTGHFPEKPIMPGVLILEALAQTSGIYCFMKILKEEERAKKFMFFATLNSVKFKTPVTPGDTMKMEVVLDRFSHNLLKTHGKVTVDGNLSCSAELGLFLVDKASMNV